MNVTKWDDLPQKGRIVTALMKYINDKEKLMCRSMAYGDFGNMLKKNHGSCYDGATCGDAFVSGSPRGVEIEFEGAEKYEMTWNKVGKLIHENMDSSVHDLPIEALDLDVRTFNQCRRAEMYKVGDVIERFLMLGKNAREEVKAALEQRFDIDIEDYHDLDDDDDREYTDDDFDDDEEEITDMNTQISAEYADAMKCHSEILAGAQLAQQGLYQMATGFKKMRDEKLYKALGYSSFEEYCENETGMNRQNVWKYISIVEKLPSDFVSSKIQIGKEKLLLLASLDEEEREEITQSTDLESVTVSKLRETIKALTDENNKLLEEHADLEDERDTLECVRNDLTEALRQQKEKNKQSNSLIEKYKKELEEIREEVKNQPIQVEASVLPESIPSPKPRTLKKTFQGDTYDPDSEAYDFAMVMYREVEQKMQHLYNFIRKHREESSDNFERLLKEIEKIAPKCYQYYFVWKDEK